MTKFRLEWAWTLSCLVGCGGGITQRTVAEAGADGGGTAGAAAVAAGGRASAGTGTSVGGSAGTTFPVTAGMPGMLGMGGSPVASVCAVTSPPLRGLSTWEYHRTVQALTGTATSDGHIDDATRAGPFAVAMGWSDAVGTYLLAEAERQGAAARSGKLLPCDVAKPVDGACATAFVDAFVGRAFRRPLDDAERSRYVSLFKLGSGQGDMANGVELVVEAALLSPLFLHKIYRGDGKASVGSTPLSGFEVASRLSFLLAGMPPDAALSDAAARGNLATDAGVEAEARRLMKAPVFSDAVVHFHSQWLGLDQLELMLSPNFTPDLLGSMRTETERFVADVFQGERTLTALLQSHTGFVDARLAPRYGVPAPVQDFAAVQLEPTRYFGVLTRASTLTRFNDPTLRGKFVRERLLCGVVPAPPLQVPKQVEVLPGQTRRQAWQEHQSSPVCAACHQLMDPIGYGFENFDELGLYRATDNGQPVNASGELVQTEDADGPFNGMGELASRLSQSPDVAKCMTKTWLSYALQRQVGLGEVGDDCTVANLYSTLAKADLDLGEMLVALVSSSQFRSREAFVVPIVPPPPQVMAQVDTLQARRRLLLDFALGETRWLKDGAPKEDLMLLDEYLTMLRDLEVRLTQVVPPGPGPN